MYINAHLFSVLPVRPVNCTAQIPSSDQGPLCLWLGKDRLTFADADKECASYGGYVVAATSKGINDVINDIMAANAIDYLWLGMTEKSTYWQWLSSEYYWYFFSLSLWVCWTGLRSARIMQVMGLAGWCSSEAAL